MVTDTCNWASDSYRPEFTHVSGTLGGGVGYMCAASDCSSQVRVEGTAAAQHYDYRGGWYHQPTLNSGDAVFCSP